MWFAHTPDLLINILFFPALTKRKDNMWTQWQRCPGCPADNVTSSSCLVAVWKVKEFPYWDIAIWFQCVLALHIRKPYCHIFWWFWNVATTRTVSHTQTPSYWCVRRKWAIDQVTSVCQSVTWGLLFFLTWCLQGWKLLLSPASFQVKN